jgi:hypothetical protein
LASELLARALEGKTGPCHQIDNSHLIDEYKSLEARLAIVRDLERVSSRSFSTFAKASRFFILLNIKEGQGIGETRAFAFGNVSQATQKYTQLEREYEGRGDVVLVGAGEQDAIRLAYTNYFADAQSFVGNVREALSVLSIK